jgi:predicted KAP-like P-loop ATPase
MIKSDLPISSANQDVLGTRIFAKGIAEEILSYEDENCITVALYGAWGTGKTSIVNMAIEHIKFTTEGKNNCPRIVKFNPWLFSGQDQLVAQFFLQLSVALGRKDWCKLIQRVGSVLALLTRIIHPLRPLLKLIPYATEVADFFKDFGKAMIKISQGKEQDLGRIRMKLEQCLQKQEYKIIVVMDDIDRLTDNEIREMFQVVKSLANLPNILYFLAFDKNVVANALKRLQEGLGDEYLEKIVQVPYQIPQIGREQLENYLFEQLSEIVKTVPEKDWDKQYWQDVYLGGMRYFFKSIRDVNRYINTLRFSFKLAGGKVNAIDLLAITSIQVFLPEIYCGIRDNKRAFSGVFGEVHIFGDPDRERKEAQPLCDQVISRRGNFPEEVLKRLLAEIFPKFESLYFGNNYGHNWLGPWRKEGKICSPENFDIFFRLAVPTGELSMDEVRAILSLSNRFDDFSQSLLDLSSQGRIRSFLFRMEDLIPDISHDGIATIVAALMDVGDLFPEDEEATGMFETDTRSQVGRLCRRLTHRFNLVDERFEIIKKAIECSERSLAVLVSDVAGLDQQYARYYPDLKPMPEEERTVTLTQLEELEKLALAKIKKWALDGRLVKCEKLLGILYRWRDWGNVEEVKQFVHRMIETDDGLIDFVTSFLRPIKSWGGPHAIANVRWDISTEQISYFTNIDELEVRIRAISRSSMFQELSEKKKRAINIFIEAFGTMKSASR